ncbi:cytochrome c biogenesis protein ResB [Geotalea toluenoxydans]|uniref:cytochrome c biogenesis protein ResB n=1 Tax=Geotalea toluenoxydans TaxID=421624 RepID=UPI0006D13891|nr:cytochrome c biogenesis protein ResB [Geotalea toluenoxydans]
MLKNLLAALKSLKVTAALIIALAMLCLLGIIVPQKSILGREAYLAWQQDHPTLVALLETFNLTEFHSSPLMMALWVLFFGNLLLVMIDRLPGIWKLCREMRLPDNAGFVQSYRCSAELKGASLDNIASVLDSHGYRVIRDGAALAGIRNRYAPLATLLFHLSFLLLLAGGVLTIYTKFRAEVDLAVGEQFDGNYKQIFTRPKFGAVPSSKFTVTAVKPTYYNQAVPVDLEVDLETRQGRKSISINRPYYDGRLSFLIKTVDVAPLFVVQDSAGKEIDGVFVKLKLLNGDEDGFSLQGYTVRARFHTDIVAEQSRTRGLSSNLPQALKQQPNDSSSKQTREIVNPAMTLSLEKDGQRLQTVTLRPHESVLFGNGQRLVWQDYTYWINFYVGQERGLMIIYAAFVLMTIALVIRFGFYRRDIRALAEEETVFLAGRSEYFPVMFREEFAGLKAAMQLPGTIEVQDEP